MTTFQATEFQDARGSSNKFYRVFLGPDSVIIHRGRIGPYKVVLTSSSP